MSSNYPILSLNIIGGETNIATDNCALKQNKSEMLARGTYDYISSLRNELLENQGFRVPEDWDHEWDKMTGPIWTPDGMTNLNTWLLPEYFRPETTDTDKCTEATNRVDGGEDLVQNTASNMPYLVARADEKNFTVLDFKNKPFMAADSSEWNAGTGDFSCHVVVQGATNLGVIACKTKGATGWGLQADYSGSSKKYVFTIGGSAFEVNEVGGDLAIVSCGRNGGFPYIHVITSSSNSNDIALVTDSTDVSSPYSKPTIGKSSASIDGKYTGFLYELVYVEGTLSSANEINIQGYLGWKYGMQPFNHTYTSAPPRASIV